MLEGPPSSLRMLAAGTLLGLAVMTKGPLAIALVALALIIHAVLRRSSPLNMLGCSWLWVVFGVAAGIGALWYVPAFLQDPQLFRVQIVEENFGHLMPSQLGGIGEAARPFYYEWLRIIGAALPLILYFPAALARLSLERNYRDPIWYQLAMVLAVLAVFTFGNSKRDIYILPALPPLAIVLIAPFTPPSVAVRSRLVSILTNGASTVSGLAFLIVALSSLCLAYHPALLGKLTMQSSDAAYLQLTLREFAWSSFRFVVITLTIIVSSIVALMLVKADRSHSAGVSIGIASLAGVSLWIGLLKPELSLRRTLKPFALLAQPIVEGHPLYGALPREYELSYYLGRAIPGWRRSMLHPASRCASYLIVRSRQLTSVFLDATMERRLLLQYDTGDSGGPVLLLNVGGPDLSAGCAEQ
jgi:4-amino-4-deoxy-L-arabinose transferase-like glycosyltransferase